jgi:hypothetical protein
MKGSTATNASSFAVFSQRGTRLHIVILSYEARVDARCRHLCVHDPEPKYDDMKGCNVDARCAICGVLNGKDAGIIAPFDDDEVLDPARLRAIRGGSPRKKRA